MNTTKYKISLETGIYCPFCGVKVQEDEVAFSTCDHVLFIVRNGGFSYVNENSPYYEEPDLCGMTIEEFIELLDIKILRINFIESHLELGNGFIVFKYEGGK